MVVMDSTTGGVATYLEQIRVEFLSKMEERLGVMVEVVNLKDGLRCREVVLLKVVI